MFIVWLEQGTDVQTQDILLIALNSTDLYT